MAWEGRVTARVLDFAVEFGEDAGFIVESAEEAKKEALNELYNYVRNASPKELWGFLESIADFQIEEYDEGLGYKPA